MQGWDVLLRQMEVPDSVDKQPVVMPKKTKPPESDDQIDPDEAQRRMDEAVRRMLGTKPETHEEMVDRKHRRGEIKPRKGRS